MQITSPVKTRLCLLIGLMLSPMLHALQEIPVPDLQRSETIIRDTHAELYGTFLKAKEQLTGIDLGTAYGQLGMFYQAHDFTESALASYRNAMELSPFDARWQYLAAFILSNLGEFDEARSLFEKSLKINADYLPAKVRIAEILIKQGQFDRARTVLEAAQKQAPDFARTLSNLGTVAMQQGRYAEAVKIFQRVLEIQPGATQVNFLLSQAHAANGDQAASEQFMQRKGNSPVEMYDEVLQKMRLHSVSPGYYSEAAIHAYMKGDMPLAEKLIVHAIRLAPDNVNPYFTLLNVMMNRGEYDQGRQMIRSLLDQHPDDFRLYYSLGVLDEVNGNDAGAVTHYNKVLSLNPKDKRTRLLLANALMRLGQYGAALDQLNTARSNDPDNPYIDYATGVLQATQSQCGPAMDSLYSAIDKQPENFRYLVAFVKIVAVCLPSDEKTVADALNAARNMYLSSPQQPVVEALAMIEASLGNQRDAVDYQTQAIFSALSAGANETQMNNLKTNLKRYEAGQLPKRPFFAEDIDLHPERVDAMTAPN